jgi:rare lipoprotein A
VRLSACGIVRTTYWLTKGTVVMVYKITIFAGKTVYKIGEFTFDVVTAPLSWPLTHNEIETIDGPSPKEAIAQGRIKASPYVVRGNAMSPWGSSRRKATGKKESHPGTGMKPTSSRAGT